MKTTLRSTAVVCVLLAGAGLMSQGRALWHWATREPTGDELLVVSAAIGDFDNARRALADGASLDARSMSGAPPLALAATAGDSRLVSFLLAHGADVNTSFEDGRTALLLATAGPGDPRTIRALLEAGADPDGAQATGGACPPLVCAAMRGRLECIEALLAYGADPNLRGSGPNDWSPLEAAVENGRDDVIPLLRRAGAVR